MNWIKSSEQLPPPSNSMNTIKVLCWFQNAPILGWYNPILGWRINNSPSEWEIEWWCEITPPTIAQQPQGAIPTAPSAADVVRN
jgi:hypothetical protein